MKIIISDKIPTPKGHYSPIIEHNGLLYISGQLPFTMDKQRQMPEGIKAQTELILNNIQLLLAEAGSDKNQILQMRLYISDIELWGAVNDVYASFFGNHKPTRCVVPTRELHYGALIEVEATAFVA